MTQQDELKDISSFEERMERLQIIVKELNQGGLKLEESVVLYKEGKALVNSCKVLLDEAKNEMEIATKDGYESFSITENS